MVPDDLLQYHIRICLERLLNDFQLQGDRFGVEHYFDELIIFVSGISNHADD